ncbi:lactonase family protein [Acidisoma cellulosilytica]|uniref:Lactonase family protein n=1 Tax=Acidisoma cellulosilyticum TaxID=2802395 RepID=A0A964E448_9PROT|nr:lactonase family protein [Acidisoma cellulosilyticum]MCB8880907.1 lactonase family protein [Acidisoma cellulosilyticum]
MSQDDADMLLVVGTYTSTLPHVVGKGLGIHLLGFDSRTGSISDGPVFRGVDNPTWLTISKDGQRLYSVREVAEEDDSAIDCFALDIEKRSLTRLASAPSYGSWPCHVSLDEAERRLFVSNYFTGRFATIRLDADRLPTSDVTLIQHEGGSVNPERQEGPHLHQALPTPDGQHVIVCDAGLDRLMRYRLTDDGIEKTANLSIAADPGSFPRHLAFTPDGAGFLVIHELSNTVASYRMAGDRIEPMGGLSILPTDWDGDSSAAALHIHPSGRFAFASNRGHDSICCIDLRDGLGRLSVLGWVSACGEAPRDFAIDPTGRFLIVATQNSDNLAVYDIDIETGDLSLRSAQYAIGTPVCLSFVNLPVQ